MGAPYFSKSFGTTFQSYFREDKKLTYNFTTNTMIFQNKTAKKLFLTWRTEREINFLKYSWNESFFSELKKNVGWSERRCTVSLHELFVWFRHIGKEKERWLSEAQTTQHCQSIFILLLPRKNSFRFVYTVWLAKMCKTQNVCWKASI